ncbi:MULTISPECIES: transporter [unclassified Devosia]|uniref:transporter n=1 Tax=unclassified Devosia TaxID=196773 RepID=UPI000A946F3D|nr:MULTISPECIES: transporter [unclassified Devosia]MBN9363026.1 transporter [Devosia sp.]
MLARIAIAALASVSMISSALAWDGARAYHLRPGGASDISLALNVIHAEDTRLGLGDTTLDVWALTPTYRTTFDVMGNVGFVLIGLPVGGMTFDSLAGTIDTGIAQGDLVLGAGLGLAGMPALAPMDYAMHKPGFQAMVEGKLFLPTGDYDANRMVNLGQNRWSFQASLPISYALGDNMIDPELTTFEIRPVLQVFGDNEDPFVGTGANVMSQAPIFGVEGHITRNFGNSVWAAIDGYYETGGETSFDGVGQGDGLETLALGATLGLVLSQNVATRLSYRHLVYSNDPDLAGHTLELTAAYLF